MNRREFTKTTAATLFGATPLLWGNNKAWAGANERVNMAVVGIHGMGQNHIRSYQALKNVRVSALCDVDENLFAERVENHFAKKQLPKPKLYHDIRTLLDDKDIDAISVVTPNHWHALAAIWGMQAGKHVSVEKPCCHNFFEGQKLVEAAAKYRVVCQDGAEQRSNPCAQSMNKFLRTGGLGEVYMAKGLCYKWRNTIGHTPDEVVPSGVHYDLWMGPAPKRPFSRNRFHYNWHWNWDYGNGDMGNQGIHEMDMARMGLGVTLPTRISTMGGHMMFDDDQTTPNVLMAMFEFPSQDAGGDKKKILQFEVRHWCTNREARMWLKPAKTESGGYMTSADNTVGNIYYGSKGFVLKNVKEWRAYMGKSREPGPSGSGAGNHYQNFVDAVRANDPKLLTTSIKDGFYTCALVHLANISYRLGRSLNFDPKAQKFVNDDQANGMLTREYRKPFVVPEKV